MERQLNAKVEWFLGNLDLQLEDLSLLQDGFVVDLYFDTVDVRDAVLGMQTFYQPVFGFDLAGFSKKSTLVHCLAASGWLGQFQMLPPHQAEFLALLNLFFGVDMSADLKSLADEFFLELGFTEDDTLDVSSVQAMEKQQLLDLVGQQAGAAEKFFKAIQCIRGDWRTRMASWREKQILRLDPQKADYASIMKSKAFTELRDSFGKRRPDKPMSNFADAVAVGLLISIFDAFKSGSSKRVARFYVSSSLFLHALRDANIEPLLRTTVASGHSVSVLRDEDYFIFRAMVQPPGDIVIGWSEGMQDFTNREKLRTLRRQIAEILDTRGQLTAEVVNRIEFAERPLGEVIENFKSLAFLANVWLRFAARQDVQEATQDLAAASELVGTASALKKNVGFRRGIDTAIRATRKALEENVREYRWIRSLWSGLEKEARGLRARLGGKPEQRVDPFRDLGLVRFAFPCQCRERICRVVEALLGEDDEEKSARNAVLIACLSDYGDEVKDAENLAVAAAILWVANLDKVLIELLGTKESLPDLSVRLVYAAAIFRQNQNVPQGRKILVQLEEEFKNCKHDRTRGDLAVGIGYLFFHLALSLGFSPAWRPRPQIESQTTIEDIRPLVGKAIEYAKMASTLLTGVDTLKMVYALNQYLYYLVEGGEDSQRTEMDAAAKLLTTFKLNRELWQYRYDDSLARYFHRLACSATTEEGWTNHMLYAQRHMEEAVEGSYGEGEIVAYQSILEVNFAAGFQAASDQRLSTK